MSWFSKESDELTREDIIAMRDQLNTMLGEKPMKKIEKVNYLCLGHTVAEKDIPLLVTRLIEKVNELIDQTPAYQQSKAEDLKAQIKKLQDELDAIK